MEYWSILSFQSPQSIPNVTQRQRLIETVKRMGSSTTATAILFGAPFASGSQLSTSCVTIASTINCLADFVILETSRTASQRDSLIATNGASTFENFTAFACSKSTSRNFAALIFFGGKHHYQTYLNREVDNVFRQDLKPDLW